MPKKPNAPLPADTFPFFHTAEPFKALAQRLGVSPNTLRKWWVGEFGQEAFDARGKAIQAKAAAETGRATAGKPRNLAVADYPCESCQVPVSLNALQRAHLNRIFCPSCDERERGADRYCPVCGLGCVGEKGLSGHMARPQHGDPEAHRAYLDAQADAEWAGKQEGRDYLRCRLCGHRGVRIDGHLRAEHGLSVDAYRTQFSGAEVQADVLREARAEQARQTHQGAPRKGQTRTVSCSSCGVLRTVGLTFAPTTHETRCPDCVAEETFASKVEGVDYVVCQACGHRAASLVSHIRTSHPELEGHYTEVFAGARVLGQVASAKSPSHREAISKNAQPWRKGLTKAMSPLIAAASEKASATMKHVRALRFWRSVDIITLTGEQLAPFRLKNGKVSVGRAIAQLGHAYVTIRRECERLGLEVADRNISQALCMETLSAILGGVEYEIEWSPEWAINPTTGFRFRYDGYLPSHRLVVEYHGSQHFHWPNWTGMSAESFAEQQERDRIKENLVHQDPTLRYFLVREDEPYTDPEYLRGRLLDEGFLDP